MAPHRSHLSSHPIPRWLAVCACLALALAVTACGAVYAATAEDTFEQVLPLAAGGEVSVENVNGSIEVDSWDRDEVRIVALKKTRAGDESQAREALEALRVVVEPAADRIAVRVEYPKKRDGFGWMFGNGVNGGVEFRVTVPDSARVAVETVNGAIVVRDTGGPVEARTTNGGIDVFGARGKVDATTTNGGISAELLEASSGEGMRLRSTNGGIDLLLPSAIQADLDLSTTNGGISVDLPVTTVKRQSKRHFEGSVNGGGARIEVSTTNGGIGVQGRS